MAVNFHRAFVAAHDALDGCQTESAAGELRGKKRVEDASESTEFQHKSGSISENDYLKISLQLLQFQTDVEQSQFARGRRFTSLRDLKHRVSLRHSRGPRMSGQILALGNQDRAPLRRPFAHPLP